MNKKIFSVFFYSSLILWVLIAVERTLLAEDFLSVPTAYKGRFRPMEVYAKLWLNDLYNQQTLKDQDLKAFRVSRKSPADLILKMNFLGHGPWDNAPLFRIHFAKTKSLLNFDPKQDRFSYNELHKAIIDNETTNIRFIAHLILYHYFKALKEASTQSQKIELTALSPGLWIMPRQNELIVAAAPKTAPWQRLKPGMILASNRKELEKGFIEKHRLSADEMLNLLNSLQQYLQIQPAQRVGQDLMNALENLQHLSPKEIAAAIEEMLPLNQRLEQSGSLLFLLPAKTGRGKWLPLNALGTQVYDPKANALTPAPNFTLYSDAHFQQLQSLYFKLIDLYPSPDKEEQIDQTLNLMAVLLKEGYQKLAGKAYEQGGGNRLTYPSNLQIALEQLYYRFPFIPVAIFLYGSACVLFCLSLWQRNKTIESLGMGLALTAFLFHTLILGIRCFILLRPPVSNMFETVIYVPWVGMAIGFFLRYFFKSIFIVFTSCAASLILIALLQIANINHSLENVQAVLNSQYWLIIHVMLVVGSYGAFVLSGLLAHFYLINAPKAKDKAASGHTIPKLIIQTMYIGVAMLVTGTLLGGVWAAESWGRFWDWDPKESWAFISICIYLIWIHAYNFRFIQEFGLAVGSISGLAAISFTWYGVNYILGTGLHSYGFGNGGEIFYYLYLFGEALFLTWIYYTHRKKRVDIKKESMIVVKKN